MDATTSAGLCKILQTNNVLCTLVQDCQINKTDTASKKPGNYMNGLIPYTIFKKWEPYRKLRIWRVDLTCGLVYTRGISSDAVHLFPRSSMTKVTTWCFSFFHINSQTQHGCELYWMKNRPVNLGLTWSKLNLIGDALPFPRMVLQIVSSKKLDTSPKQWCPWFTNGSKSLPNLSGPPSSEWRTQRFCNP